MATIDGTNGDDQLSGGGGNDLIRGFDGNDEMFGGDGNDKLVGGEGQDQMRGGRGDDTFVGTDSIDGTGARDDSVFFHEQTSLSTGIKVDLKNGTGTDGTGGHDTYVDIFRVTGTYLDDTIRGTNGNDAIFGEDGDDVLDGRGGFDFTWYGRASGGVTVDLAAGTATGAAGHDQLISFEGAGGSNFSDKIYGTDRTGVEEYFTLDAYGDQYTPNFTKGTDDFLNGRGGVDWIGYSHTSASVKIDLENDRAIDGSGHTDTLRNIELASGSQANDKITGANEEVNRLYGNGGNDKIFGLSSADVLDGGDGNDQLDGGSGKDQLTGGSGNDTFVFVSPGQAGDDILDFRRGGGERDHIEIDASNFGGGLAAGQPLDPEAFRSSTGNLALEGDDRFIFRTTDQTLWFDKDGADGAGPQLVADLQSGVTLTSSDFILV